MKQAYNKREILKSLYNLNKIWGVSITWKKFNSTVFNYETGKMLNDYDVQTIRGILLPANVSRESLYKMNLVKIAGFYDKDRRFLIVPTHNFDANWNMETYLNDEVIAEGRRYTPESIDDYGFKYAYLVKLINIRGSQTNNITEQHVTTGVILNGSVNP